MPRRLYNKISIIHSYMINNTQLHNNILWIFAWNIMSLSEEILKPLWPQLWENLTASWPWWRQVSGAQKRQWSPIISHGLCVSCRKIECMLERQTGIIFCCVFVKAKSRCFFGSRSCVRNWSTFTLLLPELVSSLWYLTAMKKRENTCLNTLWNGI